MLPSTTPHVLGNAALARFDTIVIGSGASGAAVARTLAKAGQQVLVLEAGDNHFPGLDDPGGLAPPVFSNDEVKHRIRGLAAQDPLVEPRSFRPDTSSGLRTIVGDVHASPRNVGGAAVYASMKYPRFHQTDFQRGTQLGAVPGASFADWPIGYGTLERFYVEIEHLVGVQGPEGGNADPFAPAKSKSYPMAPGLPMYGSTILASAARRLGYHPFAYPTAIASQPYRGRPACVDCGFCEGYGCPTHAKSSPAVTLLRDALLTDRVQLRFNCAVTRLVPSATRNAAAGVEYVDPEGARVTVSGDRYVLAASAIESARLLLATGDGFGNSSGQIGRNLMVQARTTVLGVLNDRVHGHRGRSGTTGLSNFRGVPGDPQRPLGGVVDLVSPSDLIAEAKQYAIELGVIGAPLKALLRTSALRDKVVALVMHGEDAPQPTNLVDLDPELVDVYGRRAARITYADHAFERRAREHYLPQMRALIQEAGAQFSIGQDPRPSASRHVMGTLRMGTDPTTSVCDRVGKLHDLGNVWAADSGLFPTSSGVHPTLTIQAVALWVAANLVAPGAPENVLEES